MSATVAIRNGTSVTGGDLGKIKPHKTHAIPSPTKQDTQLDTNSILKTVENLANQLPKNGTHVAEKSVPTTSSLHSLDLDDLLGVDEDLLSHTKQVEEQTNSNLATAEKAHKKGLEEVKSQLDNMARQRDAEGKKRQQAEEDMKRLKEELAMVRNDHEKVIAGYKVSLADITERFNESKHALAEMTANFHASQQSLVKVTAELKRCKEVLVRHKKA
jgi:Asp-tRNA(Asn)/Glu-tRNA(Gln) amidotransferase A subunit family amidase